MDYINTSHKSNSDRVNIYFHFII